MGGPNYYDEPYRQKQFFLNHSSVDFYFYKEGELAFSELLKQLVDAGLDAEAIKSQQKRILSINYLLKWTPSQGQFFSWVKVYFSLFFIV